MVTKVAAECVNAPWLVQACVNSYLIPELLSWDYNKQMLEWLIIHEN